MNTLTFNNRQPLGQFAPNEQELCGILAQTCVFSYRALATARLDQTLRALLLVRYFPTLFAAMAERPEAEQERLLVEAAQRGDMAALRSLFERFGPLLYSHVILPRVGVAGEADETLRDTLSRAAQRLEAFRWTGAGFFPWLRQIAINMIIDRARSRQRQSKMQSSLAVHESTIKPLHHAGAEDAAIEEQERKIAHKQLHEALDTLNDRYRRAIELRLIEEQSREDCAAALSVTVATFDVILHRALTALRKVYGLS